MCAAVPRAVADSPKPEEVPLADFACAKGLRQEGVNKDQAGSVNGDVVSHPVQKAVKDLEGSMPRWSAPPVAWKFQKEKAVESFDLDSWEVDLAQLEIDNAFGQVLVGEQVDTTTWKATFDHNEFYSSWRPSGFQAFQVGAALALLRGILRFIAFLSMSILATFHTASTLSVIACLVIAVSCVFCCCRPYGLCEDKRVWGLLLKYGARLTEPAVPDPALLAPNGIACSRMALSARQGASV